MSLINCIGNKKEDGKLISGTGDLVAQNVERTQLLNVSSASVVTVKTIKAGVDFALLF